MFGTEQSIEEEAIIETEIKETYYSFDNRYVNPDKQDMIKRLSAKVLLVELSTIDNNKSYSKVSLKWCDDLDVGNDTFLNFIKQVKQICRS